MKTVITIENLSKRYRLGEIGSGTLVGDVNSWWAKLRRRPEELLKVGEADHGRREGEDIWALKNVSLDVKEGEVLGIIGRNGAGKSTLLKILAKITAPTSGRALLTGRVGSLLEVGTGFHPELTGRENIFLNGAILGMSKQEVQERLDEIIAFAEIEKYIETPVKRYSSGMTVRLAFAVAAHLEPEILILDEVLAVGDLGFQNKCFGKIDNVAKERGRTVVFVSHNLNAIERVCGRVVLFEGGRIKVVGHGKEVVNEYIRSNGNVLDNVREGIDHAQIDYVCADLSRPIVVTQVQIKNTSSSQFIKTGDSVVIEIAYSARQKVLYPAFGISIENSQGFELCRVSTLPISGYAIESIENDGIIKLKIPSILLAGGIYYLSVYITRPNVEQIVRLDKVVKFYIEPSDVFGSGFTIKDSYGPLVLNHEWKLD